MPLPACDTHGSQKGTPRPEPRTTNGRQERTRVSRACDRCKKRKIRCTGKHPCALCSNSNLPCEFNARYTRGRLPPVESEPSLLDEQAGFSAREDSSHSGSATPQPAVAPFNQAATSQYQSPDDRPSPHAPRDQETKNHVTSMGASIFRQTQYNLNTKVHYPQKPTTSIFQYGDPPLPEFDTSFFVLPSRELAKAMVARYFDFVAATNRFLHRQTLDAWVDEIYSNSRATRAEGEERSRKAVVLMVWAEAYEYVESRPSNGDPDSSILYFQAAEHQLKMETGEIRLASIQARVLQCLYLLSRSRINQCWSIFGIVVSLIFAMGIQRKRRVERSGGEDLVYIECSKRTFWAAYTVDKYMSSALGRPQAFHDEDIDLIEVSVDGVQELPLLVNDDGLTTTCLVTTTIEYQSTMKASVFQTKLAMIIGKILKDFYGISRQDYAIELATTGKLRRELDEWRCEISHFLDIEISHLSPLFRRQSMALKLSYDHALILLYRPFLLDTFDDSPKTTAILSAEDRRQASEDNVNECLNAAMHIIEIINVLYERDQMFSASWFSHFCGYNAVVVLYVYVIKRRDSHPETWSRYFEAAEKCQGQIKISAERESFAQRCSSVLDELRAEALGQTPSDGFPPNERSPGRDRWEERGDSSIRRLPKARREAEPLQFAPDESPNPEFQQYQRGVTSTGMPGEDIWRSLQWEEMNPEPNPAVGSSNSIFNGLGGIRWSSPSSVIDRIDRWGFSSLTGY